MIPRVQRTFPVTVRANRSRHRPPIHPREAQGRNATPPDFLAQTAEARSPADRHRWLQARVDEAKAGGATWGRVSLHPEIPHLILYEGWKVRPPSEGAPRWQLTPTENSDETQQS